MAFQIKDIFSRFYKITFDIIFYTAVLAIILGLLPENLYSEFPFKPNKFDNDHFSRGLAPGLQWNNDLVTKSKLIGIDQLNGPESLVSIGDFIYTGVLGGKIIRINKKTEKIDEIIRFNDSKECRTKSSLRSGNCGRFLGLREGSNSEEIFAVESTHGLYRIDLSKKKLIHLTPNFKEKYGVAIYNDLVFDPKHKDLVYISVSSSRWPLDQIVWGLLEHDTSGYVLAVNITDGRSMKITEGHAMANGIEISMDKKSILIAETSSSSIKMIDLDQARKIFEAKQTGILKADRLMLFGGRQLPGEVDNIRLDRTNGELLIGVFAARHSSKVLRDYLAQWPFVRKSFARTLYTLHLLLDYLDKNLYSHHALQQLRDDLFTGHILYKIVPQKDGAILKMDAKTGNLKKIYGSSRFFGISEAIIDSNGDLYFGSFRNPFIGRIPNQSH